MAQMVKNLPAMQGPRFCPWVGKIPWRRKWLPTPVFLPREFHGQRSLASYSQWGRKESDTTEWLTREACGILAPWPGIEPSARALEGKVLTAGPPGKPHRFLTVNTTVLHDLPLANLWMQNCVCGGPAGMLHTDSISRQKPNHQLQHLALMEGRDYSIWKVVLFWN